MRFARPDLLLLLLALPLLAVAGWAAAWARRRALERFAGAAAHVARFRSQVSVHRRAVKLMLLHLAAAAAIVAIARPQWGSRLESVTRQGADVAVLLDHSLSMAAEDLAPSRLRWAGHAIDGLLQRLAGNRVALLTFAGQPSLLCPLTPDHSAVRLFLDTIEPETRGVPGTALADGLRQALRALGETTAASGTRSRAIVLFSDGEDHEGGIEEVATELRQAGIPVFAVGCGTARGGPIPVPSQDAPGGYKKDREGRVVTTRLAEETLQRIVTVSGGRYFQATATEVELDEIARALEGLDTREYGAVLRARYEERFQFPLALTLAALVAETLLGDRLRKRGTT